MVDFRYGMDWRRFVEIYMEKWKKNTISGHFRGLVPVPNSMVPVPY